MLSSSYSLSLFCAVQLRSLVLSALRCSQVKAMHWTVLSSLLGVIMAVIITSSYWHMEPEVYSLIGADVPRTVTNELHPLRRRIKGSNPHHLAFDETFFIDALLPDEDLMLHLKINRDDGGYDLIGDTELYQKRLIQKWPFVASRGIKEGHWKPGRCYLRIYSREHTYYTVLNRTSYELGYAYRHSLLKLWINKPKDAEITSAGIYSGLPYTASLDEWNIGTGCFLKGISTGDTFRIDFFAKNGRNLLRFEASFEKGMILMNTQTSAGWERYEKVLYLSFAKEEFIELGFVNRQEFIEVLHGKKVIFKYAHRVSNPAAEYAKVRISGDMDLASLYWDFV